MHHIVHQRVIESRLKGRCCRQVTYIPCMCPMLHNDGTATQETAQSF